MTICLILIFSLMVIGGLLGLSMGNGLPLVTILAGSALSIPAKRWLASHNLVPGFVIAMLIFLSGIPAFGGPTSTMLVSATLAIYYLTWLQTLRLHGQPGFQPSKVNLLPVSPIGLYTASFYATLLLAFLCLQARDLPFHHVFCLLIATLLLVLGLALWETSRRSRLRSAPQSGGIPAMDRLSRFSVVLLLFLATFLLFRLPLPWIAEKTIELAENRPRRNDVLRLPEASPSERGRSAQLEPPSQTGGPDSTGSGNPVPDDLLFRHGKGAASDAPGLPRRANLQLDNTVRLFLTVDDPALKQKQLDRPIYVRAYGAGHYEKGNWTPVPGPGRLLSDGADGQLDGRVTLAQAPEPGIPHTVYHYHYNGSALLSFPSPSSFGFNALIVYEGDYHSVDRAGNLTYSVVSHPVLFEDLTGAALRIGQVDPLYLETPNGVLWRDVETLILGPIRSADPGLNRRLALLKKHFEENYRYSESIENPENRDPLENFLFYEKTGYCRFYAHAGALMLRLMGIPSRMAYGYAGGVYDHTHEVFAFRGRDAHAWTEIHLQDYGWVTYDLTPHGHGAVHRPEDAVTAASSPSPISQFSRETDSGEPRPLEPETPSAQLMDFTRWSMPDLSFIVYLDVLLVVLAIGLAVTYMIRKLRSTNKHDGAPAKRPENRLLPPGYFNDFCQLFSRAGYPRQEGETLREYFRMLKHARLFESEFDSLLDYHYATRYQGESRRRDLERQFQRQIRLYGKSARIVERS